MGDTAPTTLSPAALPESRLEHLEGHRHLLTPREKMVSVLKGVLTGCDPAVGLFLLYLDESNARKKLIIEIIEPSL